MYLYVRTSSRNQIFTITRVIIGKDQICFSQTTITQLLSTETMVAVAPDKTSSSSKVSSKASSSSTLNGFKDTHQTLQERLHSLLIRLSSSSELLKNWPQADDVAVHNQRTTDLMTIINKIVESIQRVEEKVNHCGGDVKESDIKLRNNLRETFVPLDLLDLMDFGDGLNPDCFARGLLKEAERQLAGLQRRKLCLHMLGKSISVGVAQRMNVRLSSTTTASSSTNETLGESKQMKTSDENKKRKRISDSNQSEEISQPPSKK